MPTFVRSHDRKARIGLVAALTASVASLAVSGSSEAAPAPFLSQFSTVLNVASTVPPNGDLNPYGIVVIGQSTGTLVQGDTLVSNFNARSNLQGTGSTIVQISPGGHQTVFADLNHPLPGPCPGGVGLTTALTVLAGGYVVVGSLPVTDSGNGTPQAGCLIVLNSDGVPIETWAGDGISGPWDLAAAEAPGYAQLFVTNVLNGTVAAAGNTVDRGTVIRIDVDLSPNDMPRRLDTALIGTGFAEALNSSALVLGPTGVALGGNGTLYVADTINNRIAAIPDAMERIFPVGGGGFTLSAGGSLNGPLGMTLAPDGDIITVNGGDGNAVETTPSGVQVDTMQIDPYDAAGDLFGVTLAPGNRGVLFVDDGDNTMKIFTRR